MPSEDIEQFLGRVARAISNFLRDEHDYAKTDREVHDALRALYKLTSESDSPLGQIRARIKALPEQVVRQFDRLAPGQIPKHYKDVRNEPMPAAEEQALRTGGFREWAQAADDRALVWAVQTLTTTGVSIVPGRARGGGKRSRARIEPDILGVARGAGNRASKGGRPPELRVGSSRWAGRGLEARNGHVSPQRSQRRTRLPGSCLQHFPVARSGRRGGIRAAAVLGGIRQGLTRSAWSGRNADRKPARDTSSISS